MAQTPLGDMAESLALLKQNQQQQHPQQQQIPDHMNPLSLMQAISNAQRNQGSSQPQTSREMSLPAGLVAALVARNKLAEIRGVIRSHSRLCQGEPCCSRGSCPTPAAQPQQHPNRWLHFPGRPTAAGGGRPHAWVQYAAALRPSGSADPALGPTVEATAYGARHAQYACHR